MDFKSVHHTEGYVTESKKVNMVCVYSWSPINLQDLLEIFRDIHAISWLDTFSAPLFSLVKWES